MTISKWIVDTAVMEERTDASFIQRQFYGKKYWDIIKYTIFPINVFYIILTSIEMYRLTETQIFIPDFLCMVHSNQTIVSHASAVFTINM